MANWRDRQESDYKPPPAGKQLSELRDRLTDSAAGDAPNTPATKRATHRPLPLISVALVLGASLLIFYLFREVYALRVRLDTVEHRVDAVERRLSDQRARVPRGTPDGSDDPDPPPGKK